MDYNYEDTSAWEPTAENTSPIETTPTPAVEPIIVANVTEAAVVTEKQKATLKPFEAITLILIATVLIYLGAGIKHTKKPAVNKPQKVVNVVKKAEVKAVIQVTPTSAKKTTNITSRNEKKEPRDPGWKKWGPKK
jgi:hypothetical protein